MAGIMSEYRHLTNLQSPFDETDQGFLDTLADYRVGAPIPTSTPPDGSFKPKSFDELVSSAIVGIYTTPEALARPEVKTLSGLTERALGAALFAEKQE